MTKPTVFSYIVTHDSGFAPNPFHGYCTLACCKPKIRQRAEKGDWIVGLTSKKFKNRVVYFMKVDEVLTFADYWQDPRFRKKRPGAELVAKAGDNIYEPRQDGSFQQVVPSVHSKDGHNEKNEKPAPTPVTTSSTSPRTPPAYLVVATWAAEECFLYFVQRWSSRTLVRHGRASGDCQGGSCQAAGPP